MLFLHQLWRSQGPEAHSGLRGGNSLYRRPVGLHLIKGRKSHPSLAAAQVVDMQVSPPESGCGREPAVHGMMLGTPQSGAAWRHCLMDTVMSSDHEGWRACGEVKLTLLLVLRYSLCVLYEKRDTIFVHQNGL